MKRHEGRHSKVNEFMCVQISKNGGRVTIQPLSTALLWYGCTDSTVLLIHEYTGTGNPFHDTIPAPSTYENTVNDSCLIL
jgi:hypothetical protein